MRACIKCNKDISDVPPSCNTCKDCYCKELNLYLSKIDPKQKDIIFFLRCIDMIYLILFGTIIFLLCSGCTCPESYSSQEEYITIYDKEWNTKYYGKIRKE